MIDRIFRQNLSLAIVLVALLIGCSLQESEPEQSEPQKTKQDLELKELELKIEKIRLTIENSRHNLCNWLYNSGPLFTAIVTAGSLLYRMNEEQKRERRNREEERLQEIGKSLGTTEAKERISAAVSLFTFLEPQYERFYKQVFNLAASQLRLQVGTANENGSSSNTALTQTLAMILLWFRHFARKVVLHKHRKIPPVEITKKELNASNINLDGAYLPNADLEHAILRLSSLSNSTLTGAHFSGADLENAIMEKVDLREAEMDGTNLKGAIALRN